MKNHLTAAACLLLAIQFSTAQTPAAPPKKQLYFDSEERQITQAQFDSIDEENYRKLYYDLDSVVVNIIEQVVSCGKLDLGQADEIRGFLAKQSGKYIHMADVVAILFYPQRDSTNMRWPLNFLRSLEKANKGEFKKNKPVAYFHVCSPGVDLGHFKKLADWLPDSEGLVRRAFFPRHVPGTSAVLLFPDGDFILRKGGVPLFPAVLPRDIFGRD